MNLQELFDYKNQLMRDLCCNETIVHLLTDNENTEVPNHQLAYTQIFPYEYIPETTEEGKTFLCFDVDVPSVRDKTYYEPTLYIWVFSHKSKFRLSGGGVRMDKIASEIDQMLNGNRFYGLGTLNLKAVGRFSPIVDFHGRAMSYKALDWNRNGIKPSPSNRKRNGM